MKNIRVSHNLPVDLNNWLTKKSKETDIPKSKLLIRAIKLLQAQEAK